MQSEDKSSNSDNDVNKSLSIDEVWTLSWNIHYIINIENHSCDTSSITFGNVFKNRLQF